MRGKEKKLYLIEEILKIEDERILEEVETVIKKNKRNAGRKSFKEFAGLMSDTEAEELEKIIEEGCEQINPDDWK